MSHSLTIKDRGSVHVHRWAPSCSCGWIGVFRRHKRNAADLYRQHVGGHQSAIRTGRAGSRPMPRRHTAYELLPEALR